MKHTATFKVFEEIMKIVMNLDRLSPGEREEYMNEWYVFYKESKYFDVIEFAKFWFPEDTVNSSSHEFWIDRRGLMLYELKGMIHVSGIFPIAR